MKQRIKKNKNKNVPPWYIFIYNVMKMIFLLLNDLDVTLEYMLCKHKTTL